MTYGPHPPSAVSFTRHLASLLARWAPFCRKGIVNSLNMKELGSYCVTLPWGTLVL